VARVAVVFTGGTISMRHDPVAGGNVPALSGDEILAQVPGLDEVADVIAIDRGRIPASHFTFEALFGIWASIREALADPAIDGVVVVQGTDTIEETAFFYDLLHDGDAPIVVTGASGLPARPSTTARETCAGRWPRARRRGIAGCCVVVVLPGSIEPRRRRDEDPTPCRSIRSESLNARANRPRRTGDRVLVERPRGHAATSRQTGHRIGVHLVTATTGHGRHPRSTRCERRARTASSSRPRARATPRRRCSRPRNGRWPTGCRSR
jgi:L-asparaginase